MFHLSLFALEQSVFREPSFEPRAYLLHVGSESNIDIFGILKALWLRENWSFSRLHIFGRRPAGLEMLKVPSQLDISQPVSMSTSQPASPKKVDPLGKDLPTPKLTIPLHDENDLKLLGKGAFGRTYKVNSKKIQFAIKMLDIGDTLIRLTNRRIVTLEEMIELRHLVYLEVKALERVSNHPHIIQFLGSDELDGSVRIAMEYAPGSSLEKVRLSETKAKIVMLQLLSALQHCHLHGVAHLDVKPENIIWNGKQIKLIDFGVSRFFDPQNPEIRQEMSAGSTAYRPFLEQETNPIKLDIYAAGVTLRNILLNPSEAAKKVINACLDRKHSIEELMQMSWFTHTTHV